MNVIFSTLKKILFWCYDRGTWQYDLLCVAILAFIFFAPNWVFNTSGRATPDHAVATRQVVKDPSKLRQERDSEDRKANALDDREAARPEKSPEDHRN